MAGNWKKWAGALAVTLAGLGAAWVGVKQSEMGLARRYFKLPGEQNGEQPLPVLAFEPEEAKPQSPAMLVAHGFSGNKELMQAIGVEVARHGLRTFMVDFPGHGASKTASVTPQQDFSNVVAANVRQLERIYQHVRQKFPKAEVGVLGHSMGSGAVLNFAAGRPELAAAIPISVAGIQPASRTNPKNMLLLVGERDVPICLSSATEIFEKATGQANPGPEKTVGNFADGSARRFKILPKLDHITILFATSTMREISQWLEKSFGVVHSAQAGGVDRLRWTGLGLASAFAAFFPYSALLTQLLDLKAKPEKPALSASQTRPLNRTLAVAVMTASPFISVLVWNKLKVPRLVRLQLGDYIMAFFGLGGVVAWAGLAGSQGKRLNLGRMSQAARGNLNQKALSWAILPLGLWAFVYATLGRFSRRTWYGFSLTPARARAMTTITAGLLPYFLANELVYRQIGGWKGYGLSLVSKFSLVAALILAVRLKPELSFLVILLPAMVLTFILFELYAMWQYRQGRDFVTTGVFQALVFAWIISALFPLI
jgi:pimeloyl-ACP methyl ester carboxylesterase